MAKQIRDDIEKFHDYNIYLPKRTIYIGSEENNIEHGESGTDGGMAARAIKNLHVLESVNQEPIYIIMNNIGGDVNHGLAIYDAVKACKSHVTITAIGHAMSMGSIILQAADERIMTENAMQMIHYGTLGVSGHALTAYKVTEENKRVDKWMESMYMEKIKQKLPNYKLGELKKLLDHDTFLTATQSLKLGLADTILGQSKELKNE